MSDTRGLSGLGGVQERPVGWGRRGGARFVVRALLAVWVTAVGIGVVGVLPVLSPVVGEAWAQSDNGVLSRARMKFQEGADAYAREDYEAAIKLFKEAYTIKPGALLLLYIARSYSYSGDPGQSLDYLVRYSSTSPKAAAEVRDQIELTRKVLGTNLLMSASSYVAEAVDIANPQVGSSQVTKPRTMKSLGPVLVDVPFGVTTDPPGARIYINDKEWGVIDETPATLRLFPGTHKVIVEKDFFGEKEAEIVVTPVTDTSKPQNVSFKLTRGTIPVEIRTEPPTAQIVYVGESGETRELGLGTYKGDLPAGPAKFVLTIAGSKTRTVEETVRASQIDETGAMQMRYSLKDADSMAADRYKMAELTINSYLQGASVFVDGKEVGLTPGPIVTRVAPGYHRLEARLPGFVPWTEEVSLDPGGSLEVKTPDVLQIEDTGPNWGGWVFTGIAVAAAGAGGVFTVQALDKQSQADDATDANEKDTLQGEADDANVISYALYGAGGAALVTGVLFFALSGGGGDDAPKAAWNIDDGLDGGAPLQVGIGMSPTPGGVGLGVWVDVP